MVVPPLDKIIVADVQRDVEQDKDFHNPMRGIIYLYPHPPSILKTLASVVYLDI